MNTYSVVSLILITILLAGIVFFLHHPKIKAHIQSKLPQSNIQVEETKWTNIGTISVVTVHKQRFLIVQNKSALSVTPLEEKTDRHNDANSS